MTDFIIGICVFILAGTLLVFMIFQTLAGIDFAELLIFGGGLALVVMIFGGYLIINFIINGGV